MDEVSAADDPALVVPTRSVQLLTYVAPWPSHQDPLTTCPDRYGDSFAHAQQNTVIVVPAVEGPGQYVWTGDRWQSAANGMKVPTDIYAV
jgi:hypothetical protein